MWIWATQHPYLFTVMALWTVTAAGICIDNIAVRLAKPKWR